MSDIRCFLIEATDRTHRTISVRTCGCADCQARYADLAPCPSSTDGAHHASADLGDAIEPYADYQHGAAISHQPSILDDDTLPWPTRCDACGAELPNGRWLRGAGSARYWRNVETGEEYEGPHNAPPGAMYRAPWLSDFYTSQDEGAPLCVVTPGGGWVVDSQASNCTIPDDRHQDRHHCWIREGVPPRVTAGKSGNTCAAGAGSIQCGSYHGYLRDGYLTDA